MEPGTHSKYSVSYKSVKSNKRYQKMNSDIEENIFVLNVYTSIFMIMVV